MPRKRRLRIAEPVIAHREGLPSNRMLSSVFLSSAGGLATGCESDIGSACKALALLVLRNSLQNRHLIARAWMVSAQKGHCLVCGGLNVTVSIWYISEITGRFEQGILSANYSTNSSQLISQAHTVKCQKQHFRLNLR